MPPKPGRMETNSIQIWKVSEGDRKLELNSVIHEAEVVIRLDGKVHRRLCCLPTHLEELALGHLMSEGIAASSEIKIEQKGKDILVYARRKSGTIRPEKINSQLRITGADVFHFIKRLDENSILHQKTGGTHVVGLFEEPQALFVEDISRHCAIDKIIGLALKNGMDLSQSALVTSCRQTLSTIKKAINAQIPIVITISAPTDLAIKKAALFGITLVGFARERQFRIYCHDWRILASPG